MNMPAARTDAARPRPQAGPQGERTRDQQVQDGHDERAEHEESRIDGHRGTFQPATTFIASVISHGNCIGQTMTMRLQPHTPRV